MIFVYVRIVHNLFNENTNKRETQYRRMSSFVVMLAIVFIGIVYLYYRVRKSMSRLHRQSWQAILSQSVPSWFDSRTEPFLRKKLSQCHERSKSTMNMLYTYLSKNGRLGDCRWQFMEELCQNALSKMQDSQRFDAVVGITSGGSFVAPYISKVLGEIRCEFVCVKKYSEKGLRSRIKTWLFGKATARHEVLPVEGSSLEGLNGKSVLLVDDQLASGSTLDSATEFLEQQIGARDVHRLVLTSLPKSYPNTTIGVNHLLLVWPFGMDS